MLAPGLRMRTPMKLAIAALLLGAFGGTARADLLSQVPESRRGPCLPLAGAERDACAQQVLTGTHVEGNAAFDAASKALQESEAAPVAAEPPTQRQALSAQACAASADRKAAQAGIADEKRRARAAGVLDLSLLQSLKEDVAQADESLATARRGLHEIGARALSCREPRVAILVACLADYRSTICTEPAFRHGMARVVLERFASGE
jgi:hypothetical protein